MFDELLNILLPTSCAICRRRGAPICRNCTEDFPKAPRSTWREGLVGVSACDYNGPSIKLIDSFKERGQTSVGAFMAAQMVGLVAHPQAILVPMPSSAANQLKRGYSPAAVLARNLARAANRAAGWRAWSTDQRSFRVASVLRFSRVVADQSGLSASERRQNLAGSMAVSGTGLVGQRVILIDDVVTTGATLLEASRALVEAGNEVLGFVTFAETLLKNDREFLKTRTKNPKWV